MKGSSKDYKKFMNDLLIKRYAKRFDMSPLGKTTQSSQEKICVIFDCSAKFEIDL